MKRAEEVTATLDDIERVETKLLAIQTKGDANEPATTTKSDTPVGRAERERAAQDHNGQAGGFAAAASEEE
jgi:hypothetical protein